MNNLFNIDGPIMKYLSWFADMIILSFLWFICCIPIITIGPSTSALYYVTLKIARKEEEIKISSSFFHAFKCNFKQGVVLNLIFLLVGTVIVLDYLIMSNVEGIYGTVSSVCFFVMGVWTLCIMLYTYPLQAQFINPIRRTLKNASILSIQKTMNTVIILIVHLIPVSVAIISLEFFVNAIPVWVLLAPAVIAYVCSVRLVKIFDPLIKPAEEDDEP